MYVHIYIYKCKDLNIYIYICKHKTFALVTDVYQDFVLENEYQNQDHDMHETVTSLPNRQCPEQERIFLSILNICSPGLCPWS